MFNPDDTNVPPQNYGEKGQNPFINGRDEWDDRVMNVVKNKHAWKGFAIVELVVIVVMAVALANAATQSKIKPYMSVVDKTNYVVHVMGPAEETATLDEKVMKQIVQNEVRTFIEQLRTVIADNHAQKKVMNYVYSRMAARSSASKYVSQFYTERAPFKFAENGTVSAQIYSALPLSEKVWQVEWDETERNLSGEVLKKTRYKGIVTYEIDTPQSIEEANKNGIGFYVTNLSWSYQ